MITGVLDVVVPTRATWCSAARGVHPEQLAELYDVNVLSTRASIVLLCRSSEAKAGLVVWVSSTARRWYSSLPRTLFCSKRGGALAVVSARELTAGASRLPLSFLARSPEDKPFRSLRQACRYSARR